MFLPGCKRCGQCGCVCGELPYTLTVEFDGLKCRETHSRHCPLIITSNFGCGAAGVLTDPGGCDDEEPYSCGDSDRGPITGVLLSEPGHGYARRGRRQPVLTAAGSGSDATFTLTIAPLDDTLAAQCRSYKVASATTQGGAGYTNGEVLTVSTDGQVDTPAVLTLACQRTQPTVTATAPGGTGAVLAVTLTSSGTPPTWAVSVSVTNGGSGYANGAAVKFNLAARDRTVVAAAATIQVTGGPPRDSLVEVSIGSDFDFVSFTVSTPSSGSGATFSWTWGSDGGLFNIDATVTNGGTGYSTGEYVLFRDTRSANSGGAYEIMEVDANGGIVAIALAGSLGFAPDAESGPIVGVTVTNGGKYYHDTGIPTTVSVTKSGEYYTEDATLPVCLADVTIVPCAESGGSGAEITAVIGDDPDDEATWGTITGLTIDDGGTDYLAWHWTDTPAINQVPMVIAAAEPRKLVTLDVLSCFGSGACLRVVPVGPREMPTLKVVPDCWEIACAGGTLTPTLTEHADENGQPYWSISSVAVSGGTGFLSTHTAAVAAAECLVIARNAQINLTAAGGVLTGATVVDGGRFWKEPPWDGDPAPVSKVALISGGEGYAKLGREEPAWSSTVLNWTFTPTFEQTVGLCGLPVWRIASVAITNPNGYTFEDGSPLVMVPPVGQPAQKTERQAVVTIVSDGNNVPTGVTIHDPGAYYAENPALPPLAADITIAVVQLPPSAGSDCAVSVEVEANTGSPNFGRIKSATLDETGSGYSLLGGPKDCLYSTDSCGCGPTVEWRSRGFDLPPDIAYISGENETVLRCDYPLADCNDLPATATLLYGAPPGVTATITSGGTISTCEPADYCCPCCVDLVIAWTGTPGLRPVLTHRGRFTRDARVFGNSIADEDDRGGPGSGGNNDLGGVPREILPPILPADPDTRTYWFMTSGSDGYNFWFDTCSRCWDDFRLIVRSGGENAYYTLQPGVNDIGTGTATLAFLDPSECANPFP